MKLSPVAKTSLVILIFSLGCQFGGIPAQASSIYPPRIDDYVNDYTLTMDLTDIVAIRGMFIDLVKQKGIEAVVVLINSVKDYTTNPSLENFATGLLSDWNLGNKGLLILVAVKNHAWVIVLGSSFKPDDYALLNKTFTNYMNAGFSNGSYSQAIYAGVRSVVELLTNPETASQKVIPTKIATPTKKVITSQNTSKQTTSPSIGQIGIQQVVLLIACLFIIIGIVGVLEIIPKIRSGKFKRRPGMVKGTSFGDVERILIELKSFELKQRLAVISEIGRLETSDPRIIANLEQIILKEPNQAIHQAALKVINLPQHQRIHRSFSTLEDSERSKFQGEIDRWVKDQIITPQLAQVLKGRLGFGDLPALSPELQQIVSPALTPVLVEQKPLTPSRPNELPISLTSEAQIAPSAAPQPVSPITPASMATQTASVPEAQPALAEGFATPVKKPVPAKHLPVLIRLPRSPLTGDRILSALLSQRTLQAILFLGAALLSAAAISLVIWNWNVFPGIVQLGFLTFFIASFYTLGWFLRKRMKLRNPGIAITAVAALVTPLFFYAIFLSKNFTHILWPWLLMGGSLICLVIYFFTAIWVNAEFFGYLVVLASGSLLVAILKIVNIDPDTWHTFLFILAIGMSLLANILLKRALLLRRWKVLVNPFWWISLLGAAIIILLCTSLRLLTHTGLTFQIAFGLDWLLAGLLCGLAWRRFHKIALLWSALAIFPIALSLIQTGLYQVYRITFTWHTLGWALLAVIYFWISGLRMHRKPRQQISPEYSPGTRQLLESSAMIRVGWILVILAGVLSIFNISAMGSVHLLLAIASILAIRLQHKPWLSLVASFFLLTSTAAWLGKQGGSLAQLGLAWALLSILQIVVGIHLGRRLVKPLERLAYTFPIFLSSWMIGLIAIPLSLISLSQVTLVYLVGNWMLVNAWLALLAEDPQLNEIQALQTDSKNKNRLRLSLLHWREVVHWCAVLSSLVWLGLSWRGWLNQPFNAWLGLAYILMACLWLGLGAWLSHWKKGYGKAWRVSAQLSAIIGLGINLFYSPTNQSYGTTFAVLLAAAFYFASATLLKQRWYLAAGGLAFPIGWLLLLDHLHGNPLGGPFGLAIAITLMMSSAGLLEHFRRVERKFLEPLYLTSQVVSAIGILWAVQMTVSHNFNPDALLWSAAMLGILLLTTVWYTWHSGLERYAHISAWLGVAVAGCLSYAISRNSPITPVRSALFTAAYLLGERGLWWGVLQKRLSGHISARMIELDALVPRLWHLFRRSLLIAGFALSAYTIFMALVRNLLWLGGGRQLETWSTIALLLVVILFGGCSILYRHTLSTRLLAWLAAALLFVPWTLLTRLGWFIFPVPNLPGYAIGWILLALFELLISFGLQRCKRAKRSAWSQAPRLLAHILAPLALLWGSAHPNTASITFGFGFLFYLTATAWDYRSRSERTTSIPARFLYPAALLVPPWSMYLLSRLAPNTHQEIYALLLLCLAIVGLAIGLWLRRRQLSYRWPIFLAAYTSLLAGTALAAHDQRWLIGTLFLDTIIAALSAWVFRQPLWIYPASAAFPAAVALLLTTIKLPTTRHGWVLLGVTCIYLMVARLLSGSPSAGQSKPSETKVSTYASPLFAAAFVLATLSLLPSSLDLVGALVG